VGELMKLIQILNSPIALYLLLLMPFAQKNQWRIRCSCGGYKCWV